MIIIAVLGIFLQDGGLQFSQGISKKIPGYGRINYTRGAGLDHAWSSGLFKIQFPVIQDLTFLH